MQNGSLRCILFYLQLIDHWLTKIPDIRFWMNVPSSKITSRECLSEVRSLLNCASNIAFVRTFRGSEAQMFVDFLDQVSKSFQPSYTGNLTATNAGARPVAPRQQTPAAELTAYSQDVQSSQDPTLIIYSSGGAHTSWGGPLLWRDRRRELREIRRKRRGNKTSQDEQGRPRQDIQGTFDPPYKPSPLRFLPAVMSRNHRLETPVPPKHPTPVGGFRIYTSILFLHSHRVDAQRQYYAVCRVQPRSKPLAVGELARYFLVVPPLLTNHQSPAF